MYEDEERLELFQHELNEEYSSDSGKESESMHENENLDFVRPSSKSIFILPDDPSEILRPKLNDTLSRMSLAQTQKFLSSRHDSLSPVRKSIRNLYRLSDNKGN